MILHFIVSNVYCVNSYNAICGNQNDYSCEHCICKRRNRANITACTVTCWSLMILYSFIHLCCQCMMDDSLTGERAQTWPASPHLGLRCTPRTRWQHEWSGEWEKSLMRSSRAQNLNEWWRWWGYCSKTCYNWSLTFRACHLELGTWIISGLLHFSRVPDICLCFTLWRFMALAPEPQVQHQISAWKQYVGPFGNLPQSAQKPLPTHNPNPGHSKAEMCIGKDYTLPPCTQSAGIDPDWQVKAIWPSFLSHRVFLPVGQCSQAYPISSSTSSREEEMRSTDKEHLENCTEHILPRQVISLISAPFKRLIPAFSLKLAWRNITSQAITLIKNYVIRNFAHKKISLRSTDKNLSLLYN